MPRAWSVCKGRDCPELVPKAGYCDDCAAQHEQDRGTRQQRGYGAAHDRIRTHLIRRFEPGTPCPRCNKPMMLGQKLDAGHSVDLRVDPTAKADRLEHASCNRAWRRTVSEQG